MAGLLEVQQKLVVKSPSEPSRVPGEEVIVAIV